MTYDPNVPNAGQSPGLFPPQANTNWTRLKTIINADHVFNDTEPMPSTDGFHKQVTMLTRGAPVAPISPANAILYSKLDTNSLPQLWYYNGTTDAQITPFSALAPMIVVGQATLEFGGTATAVAFADPGYPWAGTAFTYFEEEASFNFYSILRTGSNLIKSIPTPALTTRPTLSFTGDDLIITKNAPFGVKVCVWSLIINRVI